jgi:hypothetical protein
MAMIRKANQRGYQRALPGIERKTLVYGERTLLTELRCFGDISPELA